MYIQFNAFFPSENYFLSKNNYILKIIPKTKFNLLILNRNLNLKF